MDDEQLMMRSAEGDMDAFEQIVLRHQRGALGVAYRFLGDRVRAEDVVQEAFLKILAAAPGYKPAARFRTYLFGIVWRLCIDRYRRKKPERLVADGSSLEGHSEAPGERMRRAEAAERVRAAIAGLPPRQRMAIILRHYEEMSYDDIARATRCSPKAVEALLRRARQKLRDALQDAL